MLSIAALTQGPGYYLELANINYYANGGEPLPVWHGTAAKEFGLSGIAQREHVELLCSGYHHETKEPLVRNAGKDSRNPGHDLTFSAPKSVSVAWAVADDALRKAIAIKHEEAVKTALDFLEQRAGFSRIGSQGQASVKVPLLFALFEHGTSRAMDPQLHTHALCLNLTMHHDGRATAVDSTHLYHWKMAAGSMYRAAFARGLQELGFVLEQRQVGASIGFEITSVPKEMVEWFSKRRAEIETTLKMRVGALDAASPRYAELVAKETRRTKDTEKTRKELVESWRAVGLEHGVTSEYLYDSRLPLGGIPLAGRLERREEIFREALQALTEQHAHWNEADLTKAVAERATIYLAVADIRTLVDEKLRSSEIIPLGTLTTDTKNQNPHRYVDRVEMRYTTPEMLQLERQMLRDVERVLQVGERGSSEDRIERALTGPRTLDDEQKHAVRWLCSGPGIRLLSGLAGTGKTYTLETCKEIWDGEGRDIIGCAIMAKTAKRLEAGTGITSRTLDSLLWNLDNGKITLTDKSVIVLDEAAMVGTRHLTRLIAHLAEKPGARLVLVGDARQLQPILAGGPFKYLADVLGEAKLTVIRRQKAVWARDAVRNFEAGNTPEALDSYKREGHFHIAESRPQAIAQLVEQWKCDGGVKNPEKVLMLASLNSEVRELNIAAQAARISAGVVNAERKIHANGMNFHEGDRLQFLEISKELGVLNGDSATVLRVDPDRQRLFVALDESNQKITVSLKRYSPENLRLGYASTTHKAQGATLPHVHVLMGGPLTDLHMGYVQASRSKMSTHIFTDVHTAGEKSRDLVRDLGREHQKTLAHEVLLRNERQGIEHQPARSLSL